MGINFQFATTTRIIFGNDSFKKVPNLISGWGNHVFIVTGKRTALAQNLLQDLKQKGFNSDIFSVNSEPTTTDIENATALAKKNNCNVIIGVGGGSVIDAAKAIAALSANKGELTDYLEIIGKGKKLEKPPLPFIAIPTTAGTGAEVTKNSVIKSVEKKVKVSLRSDLMFPSIAVVDPVLTLACLPKLQLPPALMHLHIFWKPLFPANRIRLLICFGVKE